MSQPRTEISALGEFGLIDHLTRNNEIRNASTLLSVGDDAAVIDSFGKQLAITTDMLVEGVHFDLMYTPLRHLGYKAVVVNLSDIYAMNAEPTQITVSLAISNRFSVEALDEIYEGIQLACERYGVDLIGGDTTTSLKGLIISITAIGELADNQFVTRAGAEINDLICVSGNLGAAYMGMLILEREKKIFQENPNVQPDFDQQQYVLERFLKPEAQRETIQFLREKSILPTAMIDISDGLSSELHHICRQSKLGALIYEEKLPIHENTREMAETFGIPATTCALNGGEDYELLFTVNAASFADISACPWISIIGHTCAAEDGIKLITTANNKVAIQAQGWNPLAR